ncbi:MAG: hypothetical protein WDO73_30655 [Ignavibacteriota bacterium]
MEQITKYLVVSNALPGPIMLSHHPGWPLSALIPAGMRIAREGMEHQDGVRLGSIQSPYAS